MKTKRLLFVILSFYSLYFCYAQTPYYTETPNLTSVTAHTYDPEPLTSTQIANLNAEFDLLYPAATVVTGETATKKFNSHGFAWVMWPTNSTTKYHLNPTEVNKYWDDGSYIVCSETEATHVFYNSKNHSAIRLTSSTYRSKFNTYPLADHAPNYGPSPFIGTDRTYYKIRPKIICCAVSSCSTVCCDGTCFKLEYTPSGTITWNVTGPFSFSSTSSVTTTTGSSVTVYRTRTGSGSGKLSASVNNKEFHSITITACTLTTPVISGTPVICYSPEKSFSATNWNSCYTWAKSSNLSWGTLNNINNSTIDIKASNSSVSGAGWVRVMSGSTIAAEYNVWVGKPSFTLSHDDYFFSKGPVEIDVIYSNNQTFISQGVNTNNWSYYGPINLTSFSAVKAHGKGGTTTGYGSVQATMSNTCGSSTVSSSFEVIQFKSPAYPNPVNDILTVELDSQSVSNVQNPTFDVYLYDEQGNLQRNATTKGGTVQFNVSTLPDGIYYLHIYDGINKTPVMQQIVVQH